MHERQSCVFDTDLWCLIPVCPITRKSQWYSWFRLCKEKLINKIDLTRRCVKKKNLIKYKSVFAINNSWEIFLICVHLRVHKCLVRLMQLECAVVVGACWMCHLPCTPNMLTAGWLWLTLYCATAVTSVSFIKHHLQLIGGSFRHSKSTHLTDLLSLISYQWQSLRCLSATQSVRLELIVVSCLLGFKVHNIFIQWLFIFF